MAKHEILALFSLGRALPCAARLFQCGRSTWAHEIGVLVIARSDTATSHVCCVDPPYTM